MSAIGLLIFFSLIAAYVCGRAGSAGGALLFGVIGLLMFVNTPAGAPLPGHLVSFLQTVNKTTTPHLTNADDPGDSGDTDTEVRQTRSNH